MTLVEPPLLEEYKRYTDGYRSLSYLPNDDPKKTAFTFAINLLCRPAFREVWDKMLDRNKESMLEDWVKIASIPLSEELPLHVARRRRVRKNKIAREEPR